jgi:hypothetical protein
MFTEYAYNFGREATCPERLHVECTFAGIIH